MMYMTAITIATLGTYVMVLGNTKGDTLFGWLGVLFALITFAACVSVEFG